MTPFLFLCILLVAAVVSSQQVSNCCFPRQFQRGCQHIEIQRAICSLPDYEDCCSIGWHNHCAEYTHMYTNHCGVICGDGICNRKQGESCTTCEKDCGFCADQKSNKCSNFKPSISSSPNFFSDPLFPSSWYLVNSNSSYSDHPLRQFCAIPNQDIHISNLWTQYPTSYPTGRGVSVAVVDDGLLYIHKDIQCNFDENLSYDFDLNLREPLPQIGNNHGTSCAGIIASLPNNNECGVGIAMQATVSAIRILGENFSDVTAARSLSFANDKIDIYSCSWGPDDTGSDMTRFPLTLRAIKRAIQFGRKGLGNIFVWAGGNGRLNQDDSNYDELANSIYTIAVAASDYQGKASSYSERGSNILINAPSSTIQQVPSGPRIRYSGISTIDRLGFPGYSSGDCATTFGGTSAATPIVSGVIALMLEVNPTLHWRDVQHILIKTAEKNDPQHNNWKINSAKLSFNDLYGFGRVDAWSAVQMSKVWKSICSRMVTIRLDRFYSKGLSIGHFNEKPTMIPLDLSLFAPQTVKVEHVVVRLSAYHTSRGELAMALQSPSGTVSILSEGRQRDVGTHFEDFPFMSVQFWDEPLTNCSSNLDSTCATWYLMIVDRANNNHVGKLERVELQIFGTNTKCTEEFYLRKESDEEASVVIIPQKSTIRVDYKETTPYWKQNIQWIIVVVFSLIGVASIIIMLCIVSKEQFLEYVTRQDTSYTLSNSEIIE